MILLLAPIFKRGCDRIPSQNLINISNSSSPLTKLLEPCSDFNLPKVKELEEIYYSEGVKLNPNLARYLEECITITNVNTGGLDAKSFARVKMANRNTIIRVLIDSGNLFGTLMLESFWKHLSVLIVGKQLSVGTTSKSGHVIILGRTRPLKIYLENMKRVITIKSYVVKDLVYTINLGSHFLRQNLAELTFKPTGDFTENWEGYHNSRKWKDNPRKPFCYAWRKDILDLRIPNLNSDSKGSEKVGVRFDKLFLGKEYDSIPSIQYESLDKHTPLNINYGPGYKVVSVSDYELYPGTNNVVI